MKRKAAVLFALLIALQSGAFVQASAFEMPDDVIGSFEADPVGAGHKDTAAPSETGSESDSTMGTDFNYTLDEFSAEVFYWTNVIREENGLEPFLADETLTEMAQKRATEGEKMTHTRPDGTTPDTIFGEYDTELVCTGENLTGAGGTPKNVAYGFMETSHRENILNPEATYLGIGVRWTDLSIGRRIAVLQLFAK